MMTAAFEFQSMVIFIPYYFKPEKIGCLKRKLKNSLVENTFLVSCELYD